MQGQDVSPVAPAASWADLARDVVAIGWLWIASGALYILLVQGEAEALDPRQEALLRLFVLPSLPLAALVFLLRLREVSEVFVRLPPLTLFLVLMASSVAWSLDPAISLRRAISVAAYTVLAVWLALAYSAPALLRRLAWLALAILVVSVALAVAVPRLGFMLLEGEWLLRGAFTHKNGMGQHLGMSAILLATAWQFRLLPRLVAALGLGLCLALAWPTGSATTVLILVALVAIRLAAAVLTLPARLATAIACLAFAGLVFSALAAILRAEAIFSALGKDLTFTGRLPLWEFVWLQIGARPWLGYGFATFFEIDWVKSYIVSVLQWQVPNAHNGYLEVWLGLGIAGPLLLLGLLLGALFRGLVLVRRSMSPGAVFAVYFIPLYLSRNLVESDLAQPSQLSWVLAVIAVTMVLREQHRPLTDKRNS